VLRGAHTAREASFLAVVTSHRAHRATFVFAVAVAFVLEASSIATGFPFGFFVHNATGLKLLGVPPVVAISYAVIGWLAWALARLLVRQHPCDTGGLNRFTTPLVASFILTGYHYSVSRLKMARECHISPSRP
jgi:putative membrane protein